jgi:molybdenum cofactor cytidylyltransferase
MTIVILAAGAARRMGKQKLLLPIDGRPMIQHVLDAAAAWPLVVVAGAEVAAALQPTLLRIVRNDAPERGMSHSLALGNSVIDDAEPIAVLLADLPDITSQTIASVIAAYGDTIDVVAPRCGETSVQPVVFGPRARRKISTLPDGDTIHRLRDDPSLRRRVVEADSGSLSDIDTPSDYTERIGRRAAGPKRFTSPT